MLTSWDFWDTLVTRCVYEPTDVFCIMECISKIKGFQKIRIDAEIAARENRIEVSIDDIYEKIEIDDRQRKFLIELEKSIEVDLASPIYENIEKFGTDDIVISDMYLDRGTLLNIAKVNIEKLKESNFYISSEENATKHSGSLFETLTSKFSIDKHIGDNKISDVNIPRHYGIAACLYKDSQPIKLERDFAQKGGDHKYIAGLLRSTRLSCPEKFEAAAEWHIYASLVAPFLTSYVEWIIKQAQDKGIRTLYFLARDGQILHKIAKCIISARHINISCKYLFVSRQALHLPGHVNIDESIEWIMDDTNFLSLETIASRISIPTYILKKSLEKIVQVSVDDNLTKAERTLIAASLKTPEIEKIIQESSEEQLFFVKNYFEQEGLLNTENEPIGLVDVGWHGRLQRSIENILNKLTKPSCEIVGFYIALVENRSTKNKQHQQAFFGDLPAQNLWLLKNASFIELLHSADHPSTKGYKKLKDGKYGPELAKEYSDNNSKLRQSAIMEYVKRYVILSKLINRPLTSESIFFNFHRFLEYPKHSEARLFKKYSHSEHQGDNKYTDFVKKMSLVQAISKSEITTHGYWTAGSHALSRTQIFYRLKNFAKEIKYKLL